MVDLWSTNAGNGDFISQRTSFSCINDLQLPLEDIKRQQAGDTVRDDESDYLEGGTIS